MLILANRAPAAKPILASREKVLAVPSVRQRRSCQGGSGLKADASKEGWARLAAQRPAWWRRGQLYRRLFQWDHEGGPLLQAQIAADVVLAADLGAPLVMLALPGDFVEPEAVVHRLLAGLQPVEVCLLYTSPSPRD